MVHSPDFRALFEASPDNYLVLTPDFTMVAATEMRLTSTMTTREGCLGRNVFDLFPDNPDDPNATGVHNLRESLNRVLKNKVPDTMAVQKYDIRKPESEGGGFEERYWSPVNIPVLSEDKKEVMYIIHRVEDVTEFIRLKQREKEKLELNEQLKLRTEKMEAEILLRAQQLQEINKKLREANTELEAFTFSVSHDLRAPLRIIDGYIAIVEEDYQKQIDKEGIHLLSQVRINTAKMRQLIDDLLAFSKIGRQTLQKAYTDMQELVELSLQELEKGIPHKAKIKISQLHPAFVDGSLMNQVWQNLLSNAIKYSSKANEPVIEVSSKKENDATVIYVVKDNGSGFDMKYVNKLFGVFQRLHSANEFEGTGVGLAIVERIISKHGGKIWAEGEPGKGATFFFSLPEEKMSAPV